VPAGFFASQFIRRRLTSAHSTIDSLAEALHHEHTGTVGSLIVFKSLFLLLFSVGLLAGAASLQSGGFRLGDIGFVARTELSTDFASMKDDVRDLRHEIKTAPRELKVLWADAIKDAAMIETNAEASAHHVAQRILAFIKIS
jgi:hypothetical protein